VRSSVTASSSMGRGSVAASSAAGLAGAMGAGDEGPLLSVDRNKEERARKVWHAYSMCMACASVCAYGHA
jgi:hypothetical protein